MVTRRAFMRDGAVALVTLGFAPRFLARTVDAAAGPARRKALVAIFQRGAVDGLNVVVPYGEAAYYQARPAIAVPRPGAGGGADPAIDLDGFFGLHPRLAPLEPFYRRGHLAAVHACGSPDPTRSHFDAQDFMESGTPGVKSTGDGWLNRVIQASPDREAAAFRAVAVSPQLPRALLGRAPALALGPIAQFGVRGGSPALAAAFEQEYAAAADPRLRATGREAFEAVRTLKAASLRAYQPAAGADYPRSPFGDALREIAQLVKSDVGLQVAFAEVGGWDTHVNQGASSGQLANRLDDFARGLAALATDLDDRFGDVVIVTMSEFGRTVRQNGNVGTDHGHGNAMFVLGGEVRGGRVAGRWPGLGPGQLYEGRDLAVTTDFRDVFSELAERHLGVPDAGAIFPGYRVDRARFAGLLG
jgi:uncharacterized protein (DUF1501 family)